MGAVSPGLQGKRASIISFLGWSPCNHGGPSPWNAVDRQLVLEILCHTIHALLCVHRFKASVSDLPSVLKCSKHSLLGQWTLPLHPTHDQLENCSRRRKRSRGCHRRAMSRVGTGIASTHLPLCKVRSRLHLSGATIRGRCMSLQHGDMYSTFGVGRAVYRSPPRPGTWRYLCPAVYLLLPLRNRQLHYTKSTLGYFSQIPTVSLRAGTPEI